MVILDELKALRDGAMQALDAVKTDKELDDWRVRYLGRKGELTQILKGMGSLPPEEKPRVGLAVNAVKRELEDRLAEREASLRTEALAAALELERLDVTLPGRPPQIGGLHIITQVLREVTSIFAHMGFQVVESPEVELDRYNFELLNMPPDHPARDMWDTFYITEQMVLRTHTSNGQVRTMERTHPEPVRVILPGKCYRYEAVSARHEFMFHQVEGLAVGETITLADLKGTLVAFARDMFGADRQIRLRGSYFPFTEPSVEADMDCFLCGGAGCRMCKYTGWVEIAGAGMVHPVVLRNGGYDPDVYSGFAFGMGLERIAILKYGIDDIRLFYGNDLRFLEQFR